VLTLTELTRRGFFGSAAVVGGAVAGLTAGGGAASAGTEPCFPPPDVVAVGPDDRRYQDLVTRGYNSRFAARPESVRLVHTTGQVVRVVNEAVRDGKRIAVRSGGHCFEGFVDDPSVRILVDTSEMKEVYFDPERKAFAVEVGATLGQLYRTLYLGWGVTVPGGECPKIGVGGHIAGAGFGPLSRRDGLIVDHLYAVEVVVVDRSGRARSVVATREEGDPNRELWWAHTGGGGGNFGIVTRYWLRSPGRGGDDPTTALPKAPGMLLRTEVGWPWGELTGQSFGRLVRNHGRWHEQHSTDGGPWASLWSQLTLSHRSMGGIGLIAQLDGALPGVEAQMDSYVAALCDGVDTPHEARTSFIPWMKATVGNGFDTGDLSRTKSADAFLRKPWSDKQIATCYQYLTDERQTGLGAMFLYSYGGKINTVSSSATAVAQRDSILRAWATTFWSSPEQDTAQIAWLRDFNRDLYAHSGGVPVPDAAHDGAGINFPNADVVDPLWNTSGVPWHTLYYKENYPRLQRVKSRWDPRGVFHHALSIRPSGS
jgi:aclacinomycin oxidase